MGRRAAPVAAGVAGGAFAVTVVGGYSLQWTWTGFSDNTTVWDWLQLLVLPCVLAALPVWYRTRGDRRAWRTAVGILVVACSVFITAAYTFHWTWTGFPGKTLWDWLNLMVLPIVLATMPIWLTETHRRHPAWRMGSLFALAAFVVVVVAGYSVPLRWTGFPGNTLWDWLHLLLVPFAVPAAFTWISIRLNEQAVAEAAATASPAAAE